jgi:hypothetical protein
MFIQVLQGRCTDADRLRKQMDLWDETIAGGADGFLGSTGGVTDDGTAVAVVRFESRAHAEANSARPEQDAWWRETATCFDGEPSFADYDDAVAWLGGGSNDAGFVQVMRGKAADADAFRAFSQQPMDGLSQMRPEIIGGTTAIADDGDFTQTIYFTSEAAAREGEQKPMPADVEAELQKAMGDMSGTAFYDLRNPWFSGTA